MSEFVEVRTNVGPIFFIDELRTMHANAVNPPKKKYKIELLGLSTFSFWIDDLSLVKEIEKDDRVKEHFPNGVYVIRESIGAVNVVDPHFAIADEVRRIESAQQEHKKRAERFKKLKRIIALT